MKELTAVDAKVRFGAVLDAVERGEEFIVTRNGKRVARICAVPEKPMSKEEAVERLKTFADGRKLGMDWRKLRDEGRR
ncbi:MAG: type II toxin-antitoxin system prevent-host-death family antitoxin [Alphaproteobacteria bacterium]|nr:type II toxin-antitoxin system prevent-host-death family antitoxin [Alphaproteobacteria bacterium]